MSSRLDFELDAAHVIQAGPAHVVQAGLRPCQCPPGSGLCPLASNDSTCQCRQGSTPVLLSSQRAHSARRGPIRVTRKPTRVSCGRDASGLHGMQWPGPVSWNEPVAGLGGAERACGGTQWPRPAFELDHWGSSKWPRYAPTVLPSGPPNGNELVASPAGSPGQSVAKRGPGPAEC